MEFQHPPKLWVPQRPAIVRAASMKEVNVAFGGIAAAMIASRGGAGTWTSIASNALGGSDNGGWNTVTMTVFIPQASLAATGGTQCRLTLKCPTSNSTQLNGVYIGQASASYSVTSPAWASAGTQILFSGSGSVTLSAGGGDVVSDVASFVMPSSDGIVIAYQVTGSSNNFASAAANNPTNWKLSYKNSASDASTTAKSGYTNYTATYGAGLVKLVEELI